MSFEKGISQELYSYNNNISVWFHVRFEKNWVYTNLIPILCKVIAIFDRWSIQEKDSKTNLKNTREKEAPMKSLRKEKYWQKKELYSYNF